ncbi:MAG: VC1465 family Xer recombination activation factor [Methylophilaceae bacterium]
MNQLIIYGGYTHPLRLLMRHKRTKYVRKPFKPIDKTDFKELRLINCLTIEQTADLLHVTPRTVIAWERDGTRIPYSAYKLFRLMANGEFLSNEWKGWRVRGNTLYSPSGKSFQPHELYYISNYIKMAHYWLNDYKRKSNSAQVVPFKRQLKLVVSNQGDFNALQ